MIRYRRSDFKFRILDFRLPIATGVEELTMAAREINIMLYPTTDLSRS